MNLYIDLAFSALKCKSAHGEFIFPNEIKIPDHDGKGLKEDGIKVYEFEGRKLVIAEPSVSGQILHRRDFDFLVEYAPVLVAHAIRLCKEYQVKQTPGTAPTEVTGIKVGIPFEDCKNGTRQRLTDRLSNFCVDGQRYELEVECLPQGVGVFLEYLHGLHDAAAENGTPIDYTESGYVLDFGYNTLLLIKYEKLAPRAADSEQLDHYGLSRVIEKVAAGLKKQFQVSLPLIEVNSIFRRRYFDDCGQRHDISDLCDQAVSEYLAQIFMELWDKKGDKFRKVRKLIIGGGGAHYINPEKHVPERFRGMVHRMPNKPEFSNVRGFMWFKENPAATQNKAA